MAAETALSPTTAPAPDPAAEPIFFDVHCHAMNLSHPGLIAFVRRYVNSLIRPHRRQGAVLLIVNFFLLLWHCVHFAVLCLKYISHGLFDLGVRTKPGKGLLARAWQWVANLTYMRRVATLLCTLEQDMGEFFMLMEKDVMSIKDDLSKTIFQDHTRTAAAAGLTPRIVLTPLIMDFGNRLNNRDSSREWFIKTSYPISRKPVDEQILDVLNGIRSYSEPGSDYSQSLDHKGETDGKRILEIYPFLGINTANYDTAHLMKRLETAFGAYKNLSGPQRLSQLRENCGKFSGNINDIGNFCFAGVKVYPPLGFDPWPEHSPQEMEKVTALYRFCDENRIPITSHCSEGGFCTLDRRTARALTSPDKWGKVLDKKAGGFPLLKLNLAHYGGGIVDRNAEWMEKITGLVLGNEHVYTDFACQCFGDKDYDALWKHFDKHGQDPKLADRILFGSDFMINLLKIDTYEQYVRHFLSTPTFSGQKRKFCSENPYRFLFG